MGFSLVFTYLYNYYFCLIDEVVDVSTVGLKKEMGLSKDAGTLKYFFLIKMIIKIKLDYIGFVKL